MKRQAETGLPALLHSLLGRLSNVFEKARASMDPDGGTALPAGTAATTSSPSAIPSAVSALTGRESLR